MIFEQLYLGCLAQASYFLASGDTAVVVDPRRDVDEYIELAAQHGVTIRHVILSHIHADFVAGHVELAGRTGATIHVSHRADCQFEASPLRDGDRIEFGTAVVDVLETPGHTPTDVCLLVREADAPRESGRLLTGDTLFLGDVGRPDLAGGAGHTATDMASMMYRTLHDKLMPLADEIEVFPGHGAGSACGKNISNERSSTMGAQKANNHALQPMSADEFVAEQVDGLASPPRYFAHAAQLNLRGPRPLSELPELRLLQDAGDAQIVDGRPTADYGAGHRAGSINICMRGQFEPWSGSLLDLDRPVAIVAGDEAQAKQAQIRLARVGIEDVVGYLEANDEEVLPQWTVAELAERRESVQVIDVRRPGEYQGGHVPGAISAPLHDLVESDAALAGLDRSRPTAVICQSGFRSSAASAFIRRAGFTDLANVVGGTAAWRDAGQEVET